jgi:hypothetical protein
VCIDLSVSCLYGAGAIPCFSHEKCYPMFRLVALNNEACMFWAVGNWDGLLDKSFILSLEERRDDGEGVGR